MSVNDLMHLIAIEAVEEAETLARSPSRRMLRCQDPMEELCDREFQKLYRLSKPMVEELIELIQPHIEGPSRISELSIPRKVLTTLRFVASGSYQMDIGGNINHAVSQSSVSKAIEEVTKALNMPEILNSHIYLPRNIDELRSMRNRFYLECNFPGVIGCVDCTHIAIFPPKIEDPLYPEAAYVNRKGYHSINVQLICDPSLKITNICARYPGSTHDSFIWNNSTAFDYTQRLQANGNQSFYFLGDSGYALRPWMLTPIPDAQLGTPEEAFNTRHRSTRSLIERCNGVLKMRFRCLLKHRTLHYSPHKCSKIINSCAILHNMCMENNIPPVVLGDEDGDHSLIIDFGMYDLPYEERDVVSNRVNPDLIAGRRLQQQLVQSIFADI